MAEGGVDHNGLTLASAASQILLLRREVKFLQKQWNTARRDQESVSAREQVRRHEPLLLPPAPPPLPLFCT